MIVTEIWKLYRIGTSYVDKISISQFADLVAADMIAYANSLPLKQLPSSVAVTKALTSSLSLSTLSVPNKEENQGIQRKLVTPAK